MLLESEPTPELSILNRKPKNLKGPHLLHQLVRHSSSTDAPAIDFLENGTQRRTLTYAELHKSSDTLAKRIELALHELKDTSPIIPVILPQSPELYITLLAILKAGKAFCPISLDTPKERLQYIIQDVRADLIITNSTQRENLAPYSGLQVLCVDQVLSDRSDFICMQLPGPKPAHLAYVLYTSGSTGLPKAVSVSHRAVTQSLLAHDRHIPPFSRFLQFAAPTFDVSIFEIFFPLYRGSTLVGCSRNQMLNDLPGIINSLRVDAAELTPTVVDNLLRGRSSVPNLKLLLTIGEMLTTSVVKEYGGDDSKESILWAMYGPTEAAIHCTLQPQFKSNSTVGDIGFPLDTVSIFVASPVSEGSETSSVDILPVGEIGELVIGGYQVADEYLNRPKLTAKSFINDPEHGYLYRTGDKARLHSDGTLECLGRIVAGQIKLRGQRVELGEIEQVIRKVNGCLGVTVMVIEEQLVAFCTVASRSITKTSFLDMCKHWLPPHMVPTDVVIIDRMPQLASGKTDQKTLRAQYLENRCDGDTQLPNINGTANDRLAAVIHRSLNRSTPNGKYGDIIGIDSLGSIRVASALREQGYIITPIEVLSSQSLTSLIRLCEKRGPSKKSTESLDVQISIEIFSELHEYRDEIDSALPCTPLQEAMLAETSIRASAYCNWIEVELNQPMEPSQIERYVQELAQNNEILRSGFISISSTTASFTQVVWKDLPQSAINEVTSFSRSYSLGSTDSLLHPFAVQIICHEKRTRLLFQLHHAIYDGWSFDLLMHDLRDLIASRTLSPRPQYREVARYHTSLRQSETINEDKHYWSEKLHNYSPIRLPNYHGRVVTNNGLRSIRGETSVDVQSLYTCAKNLSVHPQVFFQAAVAYIFSLYVSSQDVVIGTVTSGRTIPVTRIEDIMGPCIASLPFRLNFSEHEPVKDMLIRTQQANRDMLRHCTLPLRDITKACGLRPGEHLFDILFVWQQSLISNNEQSDGLKVVDSADDLEYKITLEFEPREDTILYRVNYDSSMIPEPQAIYLSKQIEQVVNYFISNANSKVGDVIEAFQQDTISLANAEPCQAPIEYGPAHAVEKWASEAPEKEAVIFGIINDGSLCVDQILTYGALNIRANQLAHSLLERGVGNDQLVGVVLEKSTNLYVSILAVLKIGCGYLPITPETPFERIKTILTDAEVALTISEPPVLQPLQEHGFMVLDLDNLELSSYPNHNPDVPYHGAHLAYAIFTSGSTGKPKGVLVTQDNLMSNLEYLSTLYPTSSNSKMLQSCSQAFDVSVFEIFFSWYVGMALCTAKKDDLFYDFEGAINSLEITHLSLTPTVAGLVDPNQVPKVRFLVTAGEALTKNVKRKWAGRGLFQGYGPSETTNICTIRPNVASEDMINNIGKSFPNTSTLILAPGKDDFVPRGAIGELCFGGSQVFRGYLKRPDLNASKIINHPLYGRIYRSGDMGILLPDDTITFTGRMDDQVKIRGQRVELGEITSIVLDHSAVSDCATLLLQQDSTSSLVCFWVPKDAAVVNFEALPPADYGSVIIDLFETLSLQLPSYMVPSHLIPISHIPMTVQAKVNKRILHSTYSNLPSNWLEYSTSTQDTEESTQQLSSSERTIVEILARTLSIDISQIRRESSFFNLGVDSISAISLAKGLRDAGFGQVQVSTILKNPSVKRLSAVLDMDLERQASENEMAIKLSDIFCAEWLHQIKSDFQSRGEHVEKVLPCTPLQEAMLSSASSSSPSYQNTMVFKVNSDLERLMECWSHMFERHQILRTAFLATDDAQYAFAQVVLTTKEFHFEVIDANIDPASYFQETILDQLKQNLPPVKIGVQESGALKRIVFSCHHALYDGTAISALLGEIQSMHQNAELPATVPYEKYLEHMVNLNLEAADQYWKELLQEFEPIAFPSISSKAHKLDTRPASIERTIHTTLGDAHRFCQESSISLLSLLQSSWAKMLHFSLGENDLCFGNVVSGRTLPGEDLHRLVAPCFNTIPVRVNFDFRRSNTELCKFLHDFNIDVSPFELTPLRRIQSKTLKAQGWLFDTLFILQQPSQPLDESIWSLEQDAGEMDLPVVCEVSQDKGRDTLKLTLHYNTSLMDDADAKTMVETFDVALTALLKFPNASANDTVGFPSQSLSQSNMNAQSSSAFKRKLLHHGFEQNAAQQPDSVALEFLHAGGEKTVLSFAALNSWANQIAHALLQQNIHTEDIVPVHASKSPQFYASILGVLKSGAAFSPIHPDLPTERKKFMISELQPKVVLFHGHILDWAENIVTLDVNKIKNLPQDNPAIKDLRPTNLAYCLYTSGSTGVPKAVSVEHRAPIQTVASSRDLIPWKPNSKLLQYAATTFDMCYYDCFLAWTFGFTLCAADQVTMLNDLTATINTLGAELLDLTPSVAASLRRAQIPSVKWLYCIGEAMTTDIITEWEGACVNSYGPTEAAFCTTMFSADTNTKASIIGRPFPSTSFAVFPKNGERPLPIFGVGELYIGGTQLAREYLHNTQLSEEKFVQKCGQRFYRSGDMVRMLGDGNFEFLGRADDQVKIRGLRVELGEINHVIQSCDERISAVTTQILKKDENSKSQLVAFVKLTSPLSTGEQSELKRRAKEAASTHLPSYMVPQFFIMIPEIPRSMAGKIDKKTLSQIFRNCNEVNQSSQDEVSTHEWTDVESIIRGIYSKLSGAGLDEISPATTIYQLGLDSISAVQIAAALRKQGYQVNAADAMRHMNCRDLALFLEISSNSSSETISSFDFTAFEAAHREDIIDSLNTGSHAIEAIRPCTPLQSGMLSHFIAEDGNIYFNYLRLQLSHNVDLQRMKAAWSTTMRRHAILRTGFAHARNTKHPYAMVQYHEDVCDLPWSESEGHPNIEQWLVKSQQEAVKKLHQPPWLIRAIKTEAGRYLDLALLHAIFDAQSLQLIFDDVVAAYNDTLTGSVIPLDPVISHILQAGAPEAASNALFWQQLGNVAAPTRFPNLTPLRCKPMPSEIIHRFSSTALNGLENGCRDKNTSVQVAAMASWATVLSGYTGEKSVTFGVVLSGRNIDNSEEVVFPCITTVPFACDISKKHEEILESAMQLNIGIQQHQFTPLNDIYKSMGFSNGPLFDSIFAFQKLAKTRQNEELWTVVDEKATTEYPISIELEPIDGKLEYRLTYLPHVVPKEQASLILEQLDELLKQYIFGGVSDDHLRSSTLYSITPPKEAVLPSKASLLHELVEFTAVEYPDRPAFEFATSLHSGKYASKKWTYSELDVEGNRVAHLLMSHGISPGELVGVCFDKCPQASFAMLGILKAGAAFVALDPGAPNARKSFIMQDSGAKVLLTMSPQSADISRDLDFTVLNLDETDLHSQSPIKPSLERKIEVHDRSYCLYTSGTTGTPKGCELTHENAVQALLAFHRLFAGHWDQNSRWLQFASFHFDVSVLEQYWSWSAGICVVSAPRDLIFEDLAASIKTLDITHIDLTPSLARILHPDDVPSLCKGVFITGGESLKQEILDVWGPKSVIYNGYGPTEATIGVTMYPRVPINGKPSNIGPQFDNVGSYVLQPGSDVPVLRGGIGELCVSGKLVGKGYLNRPDLTLKAFPILERFNERVYRTGDLVRILYDGTFDFLGRADDQVKLRGQRLEIGEINAVIKQSDAAVVDVVTLVLKHPKQQKEQLVAFIVIGSQSKSEPKIIVGKSKELNTAKQNCQEKLPPYMVPTHFVALNAMPLNINNKADSKKLKEMYQNLSSSDLQTLSLAAHEDDGDWSEKEQSLREILSKTMEIDAKDITKDASFFELGMDSISVIRVARAFKNDGFNDASASTTLKNPTIRRLAKALSEKSQSIDDEGSILAAQQAIAAVQHRHRRGVAKILAIDANDMESLAPCTPLQEGMIARSLDNENGLYFNTFHFNLKDHIDFTRLREAWQAVLDSTQILRTVFANTDDGFIQLALKKQNLRFAEITLSRNDDLDSVLEQRRTEWVKRNQSHILSPFELLLVQCEAQNLLIVHMFHALYDGISIELVFQDVWNAYNNRSIQGGPPFQSSLVHGPLRSSRGAKAFWEDCLAGATLKSFPTITNFSDEKPISLSKIIEDLHHFEETRRKLNVTAQTIVQACWAVVLSQFLHGAVTLGTVLSGRSIDFEGADRVNGPLFNTIPYHYRPQRRETWASIIQRTHTFNVAAHPHQHTALRDIIKWCKRGPNQPLFEALFVYQTADAGDEWRSNDAWELLDAEVVADYPVAVEIEKGSAAGLKMTLVAQGHILSKDLAQQLLDDFGMTLRQATNDYNATVDMREELFDDDLDHGLSHDAVSAPNSSDVVNGFEWTDKAIALRREIANLAEAELDAVDENTSVFELGLDSIDAIKLSSRLKKQNIHLPVSGIMRSLNISNMLQHAIKNEGHIDTQSNEKILSSQKRRLENYLRNEGFTQDIETVLPPTPLQEAMVAEMIASEYRRYYNHDVLKLAPDTNIEKLQEAWEKVLRESPILRTSFVSINDPSIESSFAQIVSRKAHDAVKIVSTDIEPDFAVMFEERRRVAMQDTGLTPLLFVDIVRAPKQTYIVLSISHALYDGWSLRLLHQDVARAYSGQFTPRPSYEPSLAEILESSKPDAVAFWRDYLSGASSCVFPRRTAEVPYETQKVHRAERSSTVPLQEAVKFTKTTNVSLQTLGQTVHALTVAYYTQSMDVAFGAVLSGRDDDKVAELLFPTMNTVVVRCILHGTRKELLRYVQQNFSNIRQYQHFPLRKALHLAGLQGKPLETLFIYQKHMKNDEAGMNLYESLEGRSEVEFEVCVEMEVVGDKLVWRCAVREDVLDEAGTEELLDRLDVILKAIIDQPHAAVTEFTDDGTSVCGLPACRDKSKPCAEEQIVDSQAQTDSKSQSQTARTIREVLAFVSKTPEADISEETTIFHIGLDSISAIKVSSLLRKRGINLSVSEMLKSGTAKKMASIVDARLPVTNQAGNVEDIIENTLATVDQTTLLEQIGSSQKDIEIWLPATPGQVYMLSMWHNSNGTMFFPEFTYRVHGSISLASLNEAWQSLTDIHPVLRTCFLATDNAKMPYIQVVLRQSQACIHNITEWSDKQITGFTEEQASHQPLVVLLASESSNGWDLRLKIHHALYDGVSLPILMQQFQDLRKGGEVPSSTKTLTDFVAANFNPSVSQSRESFWNHYLQGIKQRHLPQPSSPMPSRCEVFKPNLLSKIAPIDSLARANNLTTQSVFLATFAKLYAAMTHTPSDCDIVIGIYLANRSFPVQHLADSPIPVVNLVPLRVRRPLETDILDAAGRIQSDINDISSAENVGVGLWEINEWVGVKIDCWINFLKLPEAEHENANQTDDDDRIEQTGKWDDEVCRVTEVKTLGKFETPRELVKASVQGAYLHSLDVEVTVRGDSLDVGLFVPEEMIPLRHVEELMQNIKEDLERLVDVEK